MGGGGAQRPVWRVDESKKTGARSARARTRGIIPIEEYATAVNTQVSFLAILAEKNP
jgi:hypothetical protein